MIKCANPDIFLESSNRINYICPNNTGCSIFFVAIRRAIKRVSLTIINFMCLRMVIER